MSMLLSFQVITSWQQSLDQSQHSILKVSAYCCWHFQTLKNIFVNRQKSADRLLTVNNISQLLSIVHHVLLHYSYTSQVNVDFYMLNMFNHMTWNLFYFFGTANQKAVIYLLVKWQLSSTGCVATNLILLWSIQ